jgi:hypothetical protein
VVWDRNAGEGSGAEVVAALGCTGRSGSVNNGKQEYVHVAVPKMEKPTLSPQFLVPTAITGDILRALVVGLLLLVTAKHVLEELELGLGDSDQ